MGISTITGAVRPEEHTLGGNTKGFTLKYASKDIFFTVTEPDYGLPKGTLMYFHGSNEFSELMGNQIEKWRDAGYRVVTFDMPGTGRSSRDAQVGTVGAYKDLLHMDSMEDASKAAAEIALHVRDKYGATQNGPLHFVSSSAGFLTAMRTAADLPAGVVGSINAISPTLDVDLDSFGSDGRWGITKLLGRDGDTPSAYVGGSEQFRRVNGQHLTAVRDAFFSDSKNAKLYTGSWSTQYFDALAAEVVKARDSKENISVIKRNDIKVGIITDSELTSPRDVFDGSYPAEWAKSKKIGAQVTDMRGGGADLIHNPSRMEDVTQAIESNIARSSDFVALANQLKTVFRNEWNSVSADDRRAMQEKLVKEGYKLDPSKVDAVPRYGGVSYTERAIIQFLIDHKYDVDHLKRSDFEPKRIMEMIDKPSTITGATTAAAYTIPTLKTP